MGGGTYREIRATVETYDSVVIPNVTSSQPLVFFNTPGGLGIMQGQIDTYSTLFEVDRYLAGNCDAIYNQLVHAARTSSDRAREFACQRVLEIVIEFCTHGEEVSRPLEGRDHTGFVSGVHSC